VLSGRPRRPLPHQRLDRRLRGARGARGPRLPAAPGSLDLLNPL